MRFWIGKQKCQVMSFLVMLLVPTAGTFVIAKFFPRLVLALSLILIFAWLCYPLLDPYVESLIHPPKLGELDDSVRVFPAACASFGVSGLIGFLLRRCFPKL